MMIPAGTTTAEKKMMNTTKKHFILVGAFLLLLSGCKTSQEKWEQEMTDACQSLEPETGILADIGGDYENKVRTVFIRGYQDDVVFRMVCMPSWMPEWMTGIQKHGNTYSAFVLRPEKFIWNAQLISNNEQMLKETNDEYTRQSTTAELAKLRQEMPEDFRQIKVKTTMVAIDAETAELLAGIWSQMLRCTHYPKEAYRGCDGVGYHFSMWIPDHRILASGKIWSPKPNTNTSLLVSLGHMLAAYVDASPQERSNILRKIKSTTKKLQKLAHCQ